MWREKILLFILVWSVGIIRAFAQNSHLSQPPAILLKFYGKEKIREIQTEAPLKYRLLLWSLEHSYRVEGLNKAEEKAFRDTFNLFPYAKFRKENSDTTIRVNNYRITLISYAAVSKVLKKEAPDLYDLYARLRLPSEVREPKSKIQKP